MSCILGPTSEEKMCDWYGDFNGEDKLQVDFCVGFWSFIVLGIVGLVVLYVMFLDEFDYPYSKYAVCAFCNEASKVLKHKSSDLPVVSEEFKY